MTPHYSRGSKPCIPRGVVHSIMDSYHRDLETLICLLSQSQAAQRWATVSVAPLLLGFVSLACTLSQSWKGWDGRGRRVMVVVVEGGGVNLSTSKGLWRYSGAHHSASTFLPLLHSLPKPFPAYQHFSAQRERGRRGNRERVSQAEAQPVSETELRQFKAL